MADGSLRYDVQFRDPDGIQRSKTFSKLRPAEAFASTVEADKLRGQWIDPNAGRVLFEPYATEWLADQTLDPATRLQMETRFRCHIFPKLGRLQLRNVRPSTITNWLRSIDGLAPRTRELLFGHVSAVLTAAVDDERIAKNPCLARSVKRPRATPSKVRPWTTSQVLAVRRELPERYRPVSVTGADLGLRQGESFGLSPDDIDRTERTVHVQRQVKLIGHRLVFAPPKYGKTRHVPLADSTAAWLDAHEARFPAIAVALPWEHPDSDQLVTVRLYVTTRERKAVTRNYFNSGIWKPALVRAGIEPTRANGTHAQRHYYASVLLDAGESIRAVSEYLGHTDPGFTLRVYTHLMPASAERTRNAIDRARRLVY